MRIVKSAIPDNIQVTKEAKQAFAKAAGIFIVYLTTCANDICKDKKKQTVAQDILAACSELGVDDVEAPARGVPLLLCGRTESGQARRFCSWSRSPRRSGRPSRRHLLKPRTRPDDAPLGRP